MVTRKISIIMKKFFMKRFILALILISTAISAAKNTKKLTGLSGGDCAIVETLKLIDSREKALLDTIAKFETFAAKPYRLGNGVYIGYGHLNIEGLDSISEPEARQLLEQDFFLNLRYFSHVKDYRKRYLLAALSYNIGVGKVLNSSLYRQLDSFTFEQFCYKYIKFSNFNGKPHEGLRNRRLKECEIYGFVLAK